MNTIKARVTNDVSFFTRQYFKVNTNKARYIEGIIYEMVHTDKGNILSIYRGDNPKIINELLSGNIPQDIHLIPEDSIKIIAKVTHPYAMYRSSEYRIYSEEEKKAATVNFISLEEYEQSINLTDVTDVSNPMTVERLEEINRYKKIMDGDYACICKFNKIINELRQPIYSPQGKVDRLAINIEIHNMDEEGEYSGMKVYNRLEISDISGLLDILSLYSNKLTERYENTQEIFKTL